MHTDHGFEIMGKDFRLGGNDCVQIVCDPLMVADQRFHRHIRAEVVAFADCFRPVSRSPIGKIIPIDAGDDHMRELHESQ